MSTQSLQALALANAAYSQQAALRRDLDSGDITLGQALVHPAAQRMRVDRLLSAQWRWGSARVLSTCRAAGVNPTIRVGRLTARQRDALMGHATPPRAAGSPWPRDRQCGFCKGQPVSDAARWRDGQPRPPVPCPRCGAINEEA